MDTNPPRHDASAAGGQQELGSLAGGRYRLTQVLGEGGMAVVYRSYDERLQVWRAIKVLSPELARHRSLRMRFLNEARTMARLHHPNIVAVHDVGTDGQRPYIVMELVEGGSLMDRLREHGPMAPPEAVRIVRALLHALEVAHEHGVVHRDIKPHNILLGSDGVPKVTDFGIARVTSAQADGLTRTGSVMGTWGFMAPEQRSNARTVDGRADLYSAAATLYTLLTDELPVDLFASELDASKLEGVPEPLRPIIRQATTYHPEQRFASAREMAEALDAVLPELAGLGPAAKREPAVAGHTMVPGPLISGTLDGQGPAVDSLPPLVDSAPPLDGATPASSPAPMPRRRSPWRFAGVVGGVLAGVAIVVGAWVLLAGGSARPPRGAEAAGPASAVREATPPARPAGGEGAVAAASPAASPPPEAAEGAGQASAARPDAEEAVAATRPPPRRPASRRPASRRPASRAPEASGRPQGPPSSSSRPAAAAAREPGSPPEAAASAPAATPGGEPTSPGDGAASAPEAGISEPSPAPRPARFSVAGDAARVLLEGGGERYPPGELPPGTYTILAAFQGQPPTAVGRITLEPGQHARLRCDSTFWKCRPQ